MSAESHTDTTPHEEHEHHGSTRTYITIFIALCLLTSMSCLTYFDFWHDNVSVGVSRAVMISVSCIKALLVMMFFMHLKWEGAWKWVLTIPATGMSIFLMLVLIPDIGLRFDNGHAHLSQERLLHTAEPASLVKEHTDKHTAEPTPLVKKGSDKHAVHPEANTSTDKEGTEHAKKE